MLFAKEVLPMKSRHTLTIFAALCSLALGCGGDSALGGGSTPSITLHLSNSNLTYGQSATVSWTSSNVSSIQSASFPVNSSTVSGSFTDTPSIPTTYRITANGNDGSTVSSTITVAVQKGSKRILFLGDTAQSGVNQVIEGLQTLSTEPVQVSLGLPAVLSADVLVVSSSSTVSPSDVPAIRSFLNAGGGVVLIRYATRLLATGDKSNSNVSAIGSWVAGITESSGLTPFAEAQITSGSVSGFPFSASLFGQTVAGQGVKPVSASAKLLTNLDNGGFAIGFTYQPASGGRLAFSGDAPIDTSDESTNLRNLFLSEVRWASGEI
ncbi:MAG: hypothetical protein JST12_18555 [Armatimonadetes bacterium]|nr:hypothetical protein [Armatimonadota bacterium]